MDDALKTRGIKHFNGKTWLLLAPSYKNFWLRPCPLSYFQQKQSEIKSAFSHGFSSDSEQFLSFIT